MKNILDKINRADEIQAKLELDRTELAKHEVELTIVTDMVGYSKAISKGNNDVLAMNKNIQLLKQEYTALTKLVSEKVATISRLQKSTIAEYDANKKALSGKAKFALTLKTKFEEQAKELGLNVANSAEYKALLDAINNNMWMSIMNIDNKDYFFKESDSAYNDLLTAVSKIKR
jgi:Zn-dependent M32 family carboxypeptidase